MRAIVMAVVGLLSVGPAVVPFPGGPPLTTYAECMTTTHGDAADPTLDWLLDRAGTDWGPLPVAVAAAKKSDPAAVVEALAPLLPSDPGEEPPADEEPPPAEPEAEPEAEPAGPPTAVEIGDADHALGGVDVQRGADCLVLYTPASGDVSPANGWGAEAAVVDGRIVDFRDRQSGATIVGDPLPIPADGAVLSGHGAARRWLQEHATVGAEVTFTYAPDDGPGIIPTDPDTPLHPADKSGDLPGNTLRPSFVPAAARRIFLADPKVGITPLRLEASGGASRVTITDDGWYRLEVRRGDYAAGIRTRTEAKTYWNHADARGVNLLRGRHITVIDQRFPKGYLAAAARTVRGSVIVMQMHGPDAGSSRYQGPILSMRTEGDELQVVHQHYRDSSRRHLPGTIHRERLEEGRENRWGFETVFAESGGLIRIWRNGRVVKEVPGYTYNEGVREFLGVKIGPYDKPEGDPLVVEYGPLQVYALGG